MPSIYADLQVALHRRYTGGFTIELRLSQPDSEAEDLVSSECLVNFDFDALHAAQLDSAAYGKLLTQSLFADPAVREKFAIATNLDSPVRLSLFVGSSAPELHELCWETLRHPDDDSPLLTGDRLLFSRYLSSSDWRRIRLRPKSELRALVAIANPTKGIGKKSGEYPLDPIDAVGEQKRANDALGPGMPVAILSAPVMLDTITSQLRNEVPDILYLVCHGARPGGTPVIYLEGEEGEVQPVLAEEFVGQLKTLGSLEQLPRLIVLASCRSAGGDHLEGEGALTALGPRLAEAGVPAVVAMQGNVTMRTIETFMPVFFAELRDHGQIDQAMARARNAVRDEPDAWMPVLFLRLSKGSIWYVPGFAGEETDFEQMPSLLNSIKEGQVHADPRPESARQCLWGTARDGPRLGGRLSLSPGGTGPRGSATSRAISDRQARSHVYAGDPARADPWQELLSRYRGEPTPDLANASVNEIAAAVGKQQREANPAEPHRVLASLQLPIYITTNPDNLLADALREASKEPQIELFRWTEDANWPPSIYTTSGSKVQANGAEATRLSPLWASRSIPTPWC